MRNSKYWLAVIVVLVFSSTAFSQFRFKGEVVKIVDGKTVVISVGENRNLTVELQGIEVPEPEQELHQTVRDHLKYLLLGKQVEYNAREMTLLKTRGQLVSNGIDISQQMLRDGAAWYLANSADKSSYEQIYQSAESQAKAENRGVWSIKNLKPAWEFREERAALLLKQKEEEEAKQRAVAAEEQSKKTTYLASANPKRTSGAQVSQGLGIEMWDFDQAPRNNLDLIHKYFAQVNQSAVITPAMVSPLSDGKTNHQIVFLASYHSAGQSLQKGGQLFRIVIGDVSSQKNFLRSNGVAIYTGKNKKLIIGKAEVFVTEEAEMVAYNVNRAALKQIAAATDPVLYIGKYRKVLDKSVITVVKKLLDASE